MNTKSKIHALRISGGITHLQPAEGAELEARIAEVSKTIYSYCRAKTSTREEAEDLSQDILLNLIRSVDSL